MKELLQWWIGQPMLWGAFTGLLVAYTYALATDRRNLVRRPDPAFLTHGNAPRRFVPATPAERQRHVEKALWHGIMGAAVGLVLPIGLFCVPFVVVYVSVRAYAKREVEIEAVIEKVST